MGENNPSSNDEFSKELKAKYKEVKIDKMIVNGIEIKGNVISKEDTKGLQELNVTVYTQGTGTNVKEEDVK